MNGQVVVMAGGLGTRLGALRERAPKILQPVAGVPFLELLLAEFARLGLNRVHFCLGHRSDEIGAALERIGIEHTISNDFDPAAGLAGTGGALRAARAYLDEQFLLWMGDTFTRLRSTADIDALDDKTDVVMGLSAAIQGVQPNVLAERGRVLRYDKQADAASFTDAGIARIRSSILDENLPAGLESYWPELAQRGRLGYSVLTGPVFDIGSPERLDGFESAQIVNGRQQ